MSTRLTALLIAMLAGSGALALSTSSDARSMTAQRASDIAAEAQMRVNDAIAVVGKMKADPGISKLLARAKGVVIVPHYLQAALVFGGRGGAGVVLARRQGRWSDPAFYKLGGGTFGVQIGGSKGALALLLMSDKAIDAFANNASTWSFGAGAGLTASSYSRQTPESETVSDIIVWSDMKGLFGGAAVDATRISRDMSANQVYYNDPNVTTQQILSGGATNPNAKLLVDVLQLPWVPVPRK